MSDSHSDKDDTIGAEICTRADVDIEYVHSTNGADYHIRKLDYRTIQSMRNCFIAFDVETTGLSKTDRIIELGAVLFENGKAIKGFTSLVNSGKSISKWASAKNHITNEMLSTAPTEETIYPKLVKFLGEALHGKILMCAHNANFDFRFLCDTFSRLGYNGHIECVDTLAMAKMYVPGLDDYKQGTLEKHFRLTNKASHRAMYDAQNCGYILCKLMDIAASSPNAIKRLNTQINTAKVQTTRAEAQTRVATFQPSALSNDGALLSQSGAQASKFELDWRNVEDVQKRFIVIDVDTTGYSPTEDRIVEIGVCVYQDGVIEDAFSSLINPGIPIHKYASDRNHITDEMLLAAPLEKDVYPKLIKFLGDALRGNTVMCAYNGKFVFDFLTTTLSRLGFDADIRYLDVFELAAKYLIEVEDYSQNTIEKYYGLTNPTPNRATSDAVNCGHIVYRLIETIKIQLEVERTEIIQFRDEATPAPRALEVCAYIHKIITDRGGDIKYLGYRCDNKARDYVYASYLGDFFGFFLGNNGFYTMVPKDKVPDYGYITKKVNSTIEDDEVAVLFSSPFDLEPLSDYIHDLYMKSYEAMKESAPSNKYLSENFGYRRGLSEGEVDSLLKTASENRISNEEFVAGYHYWEEGEKAKEEGRLEDAIKLYDKAKESRYYVPALYSSYAAVYHRSKDYRTEIESFEEGLVRMPEKAAKWENRINKAINMLPAQYENERKVAEKADKLKRKKECATQPKKTQYKTVIQMDDEGNIIKEYKSLADAAREVGVSEKSIYDSAKGKQKHAAGFRWAYKETMNNN